MTTHHLRFTLLSKDRMHAGREWEPCRRVEGSMAVNRLLAELFMGQFFSLPREIGTTIS